MLHPCAVNYEPLHPLQSRQEIGRRLKATRLALGLKATEVCATIDLTKQAWSQYENGNRRPELTPMLAFADRYGVPLDWIYRGQISHLPHDLAGKVMEELCKLI